MPVLDADVAAVDVVDVCVEYERIEVLHAANLAIPLGSVTAIVGPNGAGKTTMLSTIAGLVTPTSGSVRVLGHDVNRVSATVLARLGICLIPEGRGVFPNLTVSENLWMMTHLGSTRADIEERTFARFPQLSGRRQQLAGTLSGGEQQMLGLARALTTEPAILLLDELSMGLAPKIVAELYEVVLAATADDGLTVVLVEQFARTVMSIADRAALLVGGRVSAVGPPVEIEEQLNAAYLGLHDERQHT